MNVGLTVLIALAFAAAPRIVIAQTSDAPTSARTQASKEAIEAKQEKKKKDFASQQSAMQKASTPGRALVDNSVDKNAKPADPVTRSGDKKKDFATQEAAMQKASTPGRALVDNPIDKKAKAADPTKSASKMTPEERARLRKETGKDSKP
ncbi:MAG TPA: hypothetical protein VGK44_01095 [Casimicrobiaceae bacterium]|jgi:hypothetical protein